MVPTTNSAGRLYAILTAFGDLAIANQSQSAFVVWANTLGVNAKNPPAVFSRLVALQELVAIVRQDVERAPGVNLALFLRNYARVEQLVAISNLDTTWVGFQNSVDPIVLTELAFCASHLDLVTRETEATPDELQEFMQSVDALANQVRDGSLERDVRETLLTVLEALRHAVSMYRIKGARAFHDALVSAIAEMQIHSEAMKKAESEPEMNALTKILHKAGFMARHTKSGLEVTKLGIEVYTRLHGGPPQLP